MKNRYNAHGGDRTVSHFASVVVTQEIEEEICRNPKPLIVMSLLLK
jgi:hypothetical protein